MDRWLDGWMDGWIWFHKYIFSFLWFKKYVFIWFIFHLDPFLKKIFPVLSMLPSVIMTILVYVGRSENFTLQGDLTTARDGQPAAACNSTPAWIMFFPSNFSMLSLHFLLFEYDCDQLTNFCCIYAYPLYCCAVFVYIKLQMSAFISILFPPWKVNIWKIEGYRCLC